MRLSEWTSAVNPWIIAASVMLATFIVGADQLLVSNAIILPASGWLASRFGSEAS